MKNFLLVQTTTKSKIQLKRRNKEIDIIKGFSCISVIYIHCPIPGFIGKCILAISRYAVPFFFFISGYYFLNSNLEITNSRIFMKIRHILALLRKNSLFYCIFCILFNILKDRSWNIKEFTQSLFNKKKIVKFILFNCPFKYLHIWFILALLYCYLFMLLLSSINSNIIKNSFFEYFIICFGIIGYHLLTEFGRMKLIRIIKIIFKYKLDISHFFIFRAFPFFALGILIRKKKIRPIQSSYLILVFIFGSLLSCIEQYLFKMPLNSYIGTYFQLVSLISFCFKNKNNYSKAIMFISYIGRELSDKIYYYHIAVKSAIDILYIKGIINKKLFFNLQFIFVLISTIIFSQIMKKLE